MLAALQVEMSSGNEKDHRTCIPIRWQNRQRKKCHHPGHPWVLGQSRILTSSSWVQLLRRKTWRWGRRKVGEEGTVKVWGLRKEGLVEWQSPKASREDSLGRPTTAVGVRGMMLGASFTPASEEQMHRSLLAGHNARSYQ